MKRLALTFLALLAIGGFAACAPGSGGQPTASGPPIPTAMPSDAVPSTMPSGAPTAPPY